MTAELLSEAAQILGSTGESVTSALKRARATMRGGLPDGSEPPPAPESAREKQLIERLTHAYETGDVDSIIALFTDDAWLTMPPVPLEYQGPDLIGRFLAQIAFRDGRTYRLGVPRYSCVARLLAHRANRALGLVVDPGAVEADLDLLDRCVAIEAWRWTCDVAADFAHPGWLDRAADRAARLAANAGRYADGLRREADRRLSRWQVPGPAAR